MCPAELWYEVTHLEQAVARGSDSVEFRMEATALPENEVACTTRYHKLEQYRYANSADALWQLVENRELYGVWSETPGPLFDQCTWPDLTHTLGATEITGGVGTVRFLAQSLDQGLPSPVPVEALFSVYSGHFVGDDCIPE